MSALPSTLPAPEHAPLRGGPTLRWGVLAPGAIADDWVATVHAHTDQRVVAVASRSPERAAAFAAKHGIERTHDAYAALVEDAEVDIVYVAAPHSAHRALAELAISAGKHVLVEKPIATTAADARAIAEAARASGVFAMEAMWTRFLPQSTIVARLLADGALGEVRQADADFGSRFPFDPASRAFDPALGGGALLDLGVYSLWFAAFALGDDARGLSAFGSLASTGVDEQATVVLDYGGAVAVASSSMVAESPVRAWIGAERGTVELGPSFPSPSRLVVRGRGRELGFADPDGLPGRAGLCYQATAVAAHVAAGRTEAPEHPLSRSIRVLEWIDEARARLGAA